MCLYYLRQSHKYFPFFSLTVIANLHVWGVKRQSRDGQCLACTCLDKPVPLIFHNLLCLKRRVYYIRNSIDEQNFN